MNEAPNTEATISEIMGAITLRVLWAVIKRVLAFVLANLIVVGLIFLLGSDYEVSDDWTLAWIVLSCILFGWAQLYSSCLIGDHGNHPSLPKVI